MMQTKDLPVRSLTTRDILYYSTHDLLRKNVFIGPLFFLPFPIALFKRGRNALFTILPYLMLCCTSKCGGLSVIYIVLNENEEITLSEKLCHFQVVDLSAVLFS